MTNRFATLTVCALLASSLAGCGASPTVSNTADSASGSASSPKAKAKDSPTKEAAKVGDPITLKGNTDGSQATVIAMKVVPTTATDGFSTPAAGMRYVAVQFQITNSGTIAYEDSPMNGAKVIDKDGQQFDSTLVQSIKAGPLLPATVKIPPKGKALGYIPFEVPNAAKVTAVQFSMDSGFGDTGEWQVK